MPTDVIRQRVDRFATLSPEELEEWFASDLVNSSDILVYYRLLKNPNLTKEQLQHLFAKVSFSEVLMLILKKTEHTGEYLPESMLIDLMKRIKGYQVTGTGRLLSILFAYPTLGLKGLNYALHNIRSRYLFEIYANPNIPASVLVPTAGDIRKAYVAGTSTNNDLAILKSIIKNPNCPGYLKALISTMWPDL
jgi:hypothetical protein